MEPTPVADIAGARVLAKLGDSVTTDHISPAGTIKAGHPRRQVPHRARRRAARLQLLRLAPRQPRGDSNTWFCACTRSVGLAVFGASPEMLVRCRGRTVETRPIAGTIRRGKTGEEDDELAARLLRDPKERAEHVMLVDLARNDLGRVCEIGTVRVTRCAEVEKFSHVQHLVSEVRGTLARGKGSLDALGACFPAGTLTGAPKIRAMELIDELETTRRGIYGGAVGYFDSSGNFDLAIAIRTAVVEKGSAGSRRARASSRTPSPGRSTRGGVEGARLSSGRSSSRGGRVIFVVDNYDSFTYNLVQALAKLDPDVVVARNDRFEPESVVARRPAAVVVSPGPGRPERAGRIDRDDRRRRAGGRSAARRVPGPPGDRRPPRRLRRARSGAAARQDVSRPPRRVAALRRTAESVRRRALPFAGRARSGLAGRSRRHGADSGRARHGARPSVPESVRGAVSPGVGADTGWRKPPRELRRAGAGTVRPGSARP